MIFWFFLFAALVAGGSTYDYADAYIKAGANATQQQLVVLSGSFILTIFFSLIVLVLYVKDGDRDL